MQENGSVFFGASVFFIPYRRLSGLTVCHLIESFRKLRNIRQAADEVVFGLSDEFLLPVSVAASYLSLFLRALCLHFGILGLRPDKLVTAASLLELRQETIERFFAEDLSWRYVSRRILIPP